MKKSELRNIIKEEIQKIQEGADLILLQSINKMIDEYSGYLYPAPGKTNWMDSEIEPGTTEYKKLMSKLSSKDKQIVKSLNLR